MLPFVEVSLGEGAAVSCYRCGPASVPGSYRPATEIISEVRSVCDGWDSGPGPNVALAGPEPFAHPQLPTLVAEAVRAGVLRLRIDTDGAALALPENAAGVLAAGVRHVRVTLLGGTPGVHDVLADRPGSLDAALEGMRLVAADAERTGVPVALSVRVPVCRHNVRDLPAAVTVAAGGGARHVLLDVTDGGLDLASAVPWIAAACDSGTVNTVWVEVAGIPLCLAGTHTLHLLPVLRDRAVGAKSSACEACGLREVCEGAASAAAPDVLAALASPADAERLADAVRRAYLAPSGPGEVE